jgi:hypothetical protein
VKNGQTHLARVKHGQFAVGCRSSIAHILSNSLNLPFIPCSFGFPALWSQASILPHWTSCDVAGVFTATVSRVAGPGALLVNPHRRNSLMAKAAAS